MRFRIFLGVLGTIVGISSLGSFAEPVVERTAAAACPDHFQERSLWIEHRGEGRLTNGWGSIPATPKRRSETVSLTSDEAKGRRGFARSVVCGAPSRAVHMDAILTSSAGGWSRCASAIAM